jgi:hypothetical protein
VRNHLIVLTMTALGAAGCAERTVLMPAPGTPAVEVAGTNGVRVTIDEGSLDGIRDVETAVTPLKVTLFNDSTHAVTFRYDQVYLEGPDGKRYAALPPYEAQREAAQTVAPPPGPPLAYNRFFVAPHMRWYYPYMTPFANPFLYDPIYYDEHYRYWQTRHAVAREVRGMAIPEGVIEPGGSVSGYVFFEHVPAKQRQATLHASLLDAQDGRAVAEVSVPVAVEKAG